MLLQVTSMCASAETPVEPEVRVAYGAKGKIIAVLHIEGSRSQLLTLNATTGAVLARVSDVGRGDGVRLTDVAVIAEAGAGSKFAAKVVVSGSRTGVPVQLNAFQYQAVVNTEVAFIRAYDAVNGSGPVWKTWDYAADDMEDRDGARTRIKRLAVDRSGRLIAAGESQGFTIPEMIVCKSICEFPSGHSIFRWDGSSTGTFRAASRELGLRPVSKLVQNDVNSNVNTKFMYSGKMVYTAIIDPFSGYVVRGQFLHVRAEIKKACI